jgi:hypothetical protein
MKKPGKTRLEKVLSRIRLENGLFCGNLDPAGKWIVLRKFGSGPCRISTFVLFFGGDNENHSQ